MYNKRGLSAIVATVLIILLVIAGVTLVWTPVRKLITDQSKELEASCLLIKPEVTKACMNTANTAIQLTIENGADGEIDGGVQVIYGVTGDLSTTATDTTPIGINAVQTISVTNTTPATKAKIAPIINGETCAAGNEVTVSATCS